MCTQHGDAQMTKLMQTQNDQIQGSPIQQFSLYLSATLGIPVLFMSLGIISAEHLLYVIGCCFTLLGIA